MKVRKVVLTLQLDTPDVTAARLRGFFATRFRDHVLLHHHTTSGGCLWQYPLVQYKVLDRTPLVVAFERGAEIVETLYPELHTLNINGHTVSVVEKGIRVEEDVIGVTDRIHSYQFVSPWIALNRHNHRTYDDLEDPVARKEFLTGSLIGNFLSLSKGFNYHVPRRIEVLHDIQPLPTPIYYKHRRYTGFAGVFHTNFALPNLIGIGKAVSKGYGTVQQVESIGSPN